jgi:guanine nucleotide-binding protein alpha-1 subunit
MADVQATTHHPQSSGSISISQHARHESQSLNPTAIPNCPPLTADHQKLKLRLSPLIQIEESLVRKLTLTGAAGYIDGRKIKEACVNSTTGWKEAFGRLVKGARESVDSEFLIDWNDPNDPGVVLHACVDDIKRLWNDPVIQRLLEVRKLRIEEVAGL